MPHISSEPPFVVYVAAAASHPALSHVAPGSALVGLRPDRGASTTLCYYEGNQHRIEQLQHFEAKAHMAASRLSTRAPTIARGTFPLDALRKVAEFIYDDGKEWKYIPCVDEDSFDPTAAAAIRQVLQRWPDATLLTRGELRSAIQIPGVRFDTWSVCSPQLRSARNPVGFLGGGATREAACLAAIFHSSR